MSAMAEDLEMPAWQCTSTVLCWRTLGMAARQPEICDAFRCVSFDVMEIKRADFGAQVTEALGRDGASLRIRHGDEKSCAQTLG